MKASDSCKIQVISRAVVPGNTDIMNTNIAKPVKVAIIGASGTYGKGILARAEEIGVQAVVVTRSPHKFKDYDDRGAAG
jgi:hypothetical protein